MLRRNWHFILVLFLILDIGYSFLQHFSVAIDGDLADIIIPAERYKPLMNDPFGMQVVLENEKHASPNRFFAHWFTSIYFKNIPLLLQKIASPIDSVYLACAIIKTIVQVGLIYLISFFITGRKNWLDKNFLIVAALIAPLFHTTGYYHYMGVIDEATTYALFYALPLGLILWIFSPIYNQLFFKKEIQRSWLSIIFFFVMSIYLSLNGPLNPAVILLIIALLFLAQGSSVFFTNRKESLRSKVEGFINKIGKVNFVLLTIFGIFSLYSFVLGFYNNEVTYSLSISKRYSVLPIGLFNMFTQKVGFPLLLGMIILNLILINRQEPTTESKRILAFLKWVGIFVLIYVLLLPLGGYREYRPNIIRRDTFLPVTLCIFYAYGITSFFLTKNILSKNKKWYISLLVVIGLIFTSVDLPNFDHNKCERNALEKISISELEVVELDNDCFVMTWIKVDEPEFTSTNSKMLQIWNITKEPKLYIHKSPK